MQDYLSDVTARWLLVELARTTLLVAVLGVAAWLVLRLARVNSPALHRVCCVMVLLAGWTLVRWPVDVAWYEAPQPPVVAEVAVEVAEEPESFTPPIDPALLSPPPEFGAGMAAPAMAAPEVDAATAEPLPAPLPEPVPEVAPQPAWQIAWEQLGVAVWLVGIVAVVGWWIMGYLRFLWQMPRGLESSPEWQAEFAAACAGQGRAGRVEFRVTEEAGPLLCRLPRRTVLLVPRVMWSALDAVERRAILRHELEHLTRGDLWKSLAVRVLALPHWFNPVAWLAVRRFDDAAEWACDRAAMNQQPTAYAAMLLRLGELAGTRARFGSAMSNRPLTTRIRRLLTLNGTEDSAMKKACLMSLLLLVVPLALVRVNLVAEEPEAKPPQGIEFFVGHSEPKTQPAEASTEQPVAKDELSRDEPKVPVSPGAEDRPSPPERMPVGELGDKKPADDPVKLAQRRMVEFAKKTYEANDAAYKAGTVTLDQVFHWSNLWLNAELAIAESREEQIAAAQRNLARLKVIEANIRRLYEQGSRGGEQNAMSAANYHLADAERRLAEIEGMPEPQATAPQPAANRALVDSAKQAFEATTAAYNAGTGTLDTVISWSNRWLAAELEIARSREEQLAAAQAHLERIGDLHNKVEALYRTGSNGGEANAMATAKYYLADAMRRLETLNKESTQLAAQMSQLSPKLSTITPQPDLSSATPRPTPRGESPGKVKIGSRSFYVDDPELNEVLKSILQKGTPTSETLDALKAIRRRGLQTDGTVAEVISTGLAPELVQLLGHKDVDIREHAEMMLWTVYGPSDPALKKGADRDNPEIAKRAQRLMRSTGRIAQSVKRADPLPQTPPVVTQPPKTGPPAPPAVGGTYEDRTFQQWVEIFKTELEPSSRKLSLAALRVFAVNGHGKEVAELLISTLGPMMPEASRDDDSPDEQDQQLLTLVEDGADTLRRVPRHELLPVLSQTLENGTTPERRFALFGAPHMIDEFLPVYLRLMRDSDEAVAVQAMERANEISAARVMGEFKAAFDFPRSESMWAIQRLPALIKVNPNLKPLCSGPVHLLGSEDEKLRDAAFRSLQAIGMAARAALREGSKTATGQVSTTIADLLSALPEAERLGIQTSPPAPRSANSTPTLAPATSEALAPATSEAARPPARTLRRSREFREGMPTLIEKVELHYDGKSFDQWRTQLQTDLSPTLRKEAMYAMAEFAAHGYGKEAAEVIFETMSNYSVWTIDNSAEGQLKQAALFAAKRVATADRLPAIAEALTSGNKNERLFALQIIPLDAAKDEIIPLLVAALDDMDSAVVSLARMQLAIVDHDNPKLIASLESGLASNDPQIVQNAVQIVRGGSSRPYPTLLPKALALIDHDSPDIRDVAIRTLTALSTGPEQPAYVEALEEIETGGGPQALNAVKVLDGKIGEQRLLQRMPPLDSQPIDRRK